MIKKIYDPEIIKILLQYFVDIYRFTFSPLNLILLKLSFKYGQFHFLHMNKKHPTFIYWIEKNQTKQRPSFICIFALAFYHKSSLFCFLDIYLFCSG